MNQVVSSGIAGEVITPRDTVRVIALARAFDIRKIEREFVAGETVEDLLDRIYEGRRPKHALIVHLTDESGSIALPEFGNDGRPMWRRIRPRAGTTLTVRPRLQKGAGQILITIAAIVAAFALGGPLGGALATATGIAVGTATALVSAGILFAGQLLANALFPVRQQQLSATDTFQSLPGISGAQNQAAQHQPVPSILGEHKISPFYAASPYTEVVGDDQYLRLLFCVGYGPLDISAVKIGDTPIEQFADVEIEIKAGYSSDTPPSLFPSEVFEDQLSVLLENHNAGAIWNTQTTRPDTDEISIDITAPDGVFMQNGETGALESYIVEVHAEFRAVGATDWIDFTGSPILFGRSVKTARQGYRRPVARGQYEVRVAKFTGDQREDLAPRTRDKVVWTALRSIKTGPVLSFPKPLALIALRIRASDQLNGVVSTLNCTAKSKVKAYNGTTWNADTLSTNPADLFRHVLQGPANARALSDGDLDLDNLAAFWTFCSTNGFAFNHIRSNESSVYDCLADICAVARAVPVFIDGKWGVSWDRNEDPIVQHFTPRNSWGFSVARSYPTMPHAFRARFINADNDYTDDERIVYDDGYDATNATLFETIEFPGVTDPDLIWRLGRFHIAQARLRPEETTITVGWEHLVCNHGDRVGVTHDVLEIGLGSGRLKSVSGQVVVLDEAVTIESDKTYGIRFRLPDISTPYLYRAVDVDATGLGETKELTLSGDISALSGNEGALFVFGETGSEYAVYRVKAIANQKDLNATLTLVDDAPEISSADQGEIPEYNPNITTPVDPLTLQPEDFQIIEIMDGYGPSVRAIARLSWRAKRRGNIRTFEVQQRDDNVGGDYKTVATPTETTVDLEIIDAGVWSYRVRSLFNDGTWSNWTTKAANTFLGLVAPPDDITNLHQYAVDGKAALAWSVVEDQRTIAYEVRKGTTWEAGLTVGDAVSQPPWPTAGDGTYHIRAYVISPYGARIYSVNDASITITDSIFIRNIILSKDEQETGWTGGLDGGVIDGSFIRTDVALEVGAVFAQEIVSDLDLTGLHIAVYVSAATVDIGVASECRFWTEYEGVGVLQGDDFLAQSDVLGGGDILGSASTRFIKVIPIWHFAANGALDVFDAADVFAPADVFGANVDWEPWVAIASGTRKSRFWKPGLVLITDKQEVDATGTKFRWFVDVPDRTDDYTGLSVPSSGLDITFYKGGFNEAPTPGIDPLPFNGGPNGSVTPHVQRSIIDQTNGDEVKITNLTLTGCTVHVVNAGSNVSRDGVELLVRGY